MIRYKRILIKEDTAKSIKLEAFKQGKTMVNFLDEKFCPPENIIKPKKKNEKIKFGFDW